MWEVENRKVKEVKEKYKFYHIVINGDELYHKDNSVNNREVKRSEISDEEYEALKEWDCIVREFER